MAEEGEGKMKVRPADSFRQHPDAIVQALHRLYDPVWPDHAARRLFQRLRVLHDEKTRKPICTGDEGEVE